MKLKTDVVPGQPYDITTRDAKKMEPISQETILFLASSLTCEWL